MAGKKELGFSLVEVLFSLLLLSLGTGAAAFLLMKCQIVEKQTEWRAKTLMTAFGIREAWRVQAANDSGKKSLDLRSWQMILEQSFPGSTIKIECVALEHASQCKVVFTPVDQKILKKLEYRL